MYQPQFLCYADTDIFHVSWLKDDIELFDYNVQERVDAFVAAAYFQVRSNIYGCNLSFIVGFCWCLFNSYTVIFTMSFSFLFGLVIVIWNFSNKYVSDKIILVYLLTSIGFVCRLMLLVPII